MSSSVWADQLRWSVQQPGAGRSMIDGPGPPGTDTVTVRVLPASVALMTSGSGAASGILDTHRILLFLSCSGGECSASWLAHYKCPDRVEFGPLPKTSTGKIQKFVLRDREWAGQDNRIGAAQPR